MLFNNSKFDKGDIVVLKMVNGDEIVAEIMSDESMQYTIKKPQTVVPSAKGMGLMPSLFTAKEEFIIPVNKQHVMMCAPAVDEMVRHYVKTTTGIEPITRGSIIT
jgi:dihydroxyacetone kinase-like predicted kinase